jgi:hypothetical protein
MTVWCPVWYYDITGVDQKFFEYKKYRAKYFVSVILALVHDGGGAAVGRLDTC